MLRRTRTLLNRGRRYTGRRRITVRRQRRLVLPVIEDGPGLGRESPESEEAGFESTEEDNLMEELLTKLTKVVTGQEAQLRA